MKIINCQLQTHGRAILAILNQEILHSTTLYDYQPRDEEAIAAWFVTKLEGNYPVIGIENESGILMGFASYGSFRPHAAYQYTVELSIYIETKYRGRGIGKKLLSELIAIARRQNYHTLIGCIDAANPISIRLHESLGFQHCGTLRQVGFKFERWLDLELYQLLL
ncbi:MAG: N-acetyltransferase family protein [Cyanobacteria bacterium J06623_7]